MPVFTIMDRSTLNFCTRWKNNEGLHSHHLPEILHFSRGTDTSQKVDAIYAVLPLAEDTLGIRVDYQSSISNVFVDAAKRLLDCFGVRMLSFSTGEGLDRLPDLPSWVPDWTCVVHVESLLNTYSDYGGRMAEVMGTERQILGEQTHVIDGRTLQTRMLDGDKVETVAQPWPLGEDSKTGTLGRQALSRLQDWYRMLQNSNFGQDNTYRGTSEGHTLAMILTLTAGFYQAVLYTSEPFLVWDELLSNLNDGLRRSEAKLHDDPPTEMNRGDVFLPTFCSTFKFYCRGRTFFTTTRGFMGLGPETTRPSDGILMSHELMFPLVMRRTPTGAWKLIGECYLHGWDRDELLRGLER